MATRAEYSARPNRESLTKRLGAAAWRLKARDGHRCAYCRSSEAAEIRQGRSLHLDHLTPKSEGGKDKVDNLILACQRCNDTRHDMSLKEWSRYAEKNMGLRFNPDAIQAQAQKALPSMEAAREAQAKVHEGQARDYEKLGQKEVAAAHLKAAAVLREGRAFNNPASREARKLSMKASEKALVETHREQQRVHEQRADELGLQGGKRAAEAHLAAAKEHAIAHVAKLSGDKDRYRDAKDRATDASAKADQETKALETGPRGGVYHLSESGSKIYHPHGGARGQGAS